MRPLAPPPSNAHSFRAADYGRTGDGGQGVNKTDPGRIGAIRPLWLEADALRERVAAAPSIYSFFSFETALSQRGSNGHVRTHPAARASVARLVTSPRSRAAVVSGRRATLIQRRLRLQRAAYVGVYGAEVQATGLRLVSEPDLELLASQVAKLRKACQKSPLFAAEGLVLEDRSWALALHLRSVAPAAASAAALEFARLASVNDLLLRSSQGLLEACSQNGGLGKAAIGLLAGQPGSLPLYVGGGEADEEAFEVINKRGGITVHVGPPPRQGTAARVMVADTGEVIRLIHWLADARRRT